MQVHNHLSSQSTYSSRISFTDIKLGQYKEIYHHIFELTNFTKCYERPSYLCAINCYVQRADIAEVRFAFAYLLDLDL